MRVSRNAYYHWCKSKELTSTKLSKIHLKERIKVIFEQSREIYGSCRIQKMLEREGLLYSRSYVGLLMREIGLKSILKRKFVITTDSNHTFKIANNELDRDFTSIKLGEKWVSDITYIRVGDGWNYLTTIMDLADRKIVGWALSDDMTTENTVMKAWCSAREQRDLNDDFIFHSDRGVQYASNKMTHLFSFNRKVKQSMSRKGNCWDNAVAESFFGTIKTEMLFHRRYLTRKEVRKDIVDYIEMFYNRKRMHSANNYLSPVDYEEKMLQNEMSA